MNPAQLAQARVELDRELIRRHGFYEFVVRAWPHLNEPKAFMPNWHIQEMCWHAEAMTPPERDPADPELWAVPLLRNLVVNIPPRCMKSMIWSVLWPAWVWTWRPEFRWIYVSYEQSVSRTLAEKQINLLRSRWFRERWGDVLAPGERNTNDFATRAGGFRLSTSIGGPATGRHANAVIFDDPIKPASAQTTGKEISAGTQRANDALSNTFGSRVIDPRTSIFAIIMQRITENDPSQVFLDRGYPCLRFPMRFEADQISRTPIGGDRRTVEGELLWPDLYGEAEVADAEQKAGGRESYVTAAQLQQRPAPPGGLIFRSEKFGRFSSVDRPLRRAFSVLSVDANFKDNDTTSEVGLAAIGYDAPRMFVYGARSERAGFAGSIALIKEMNRALGPFDAILIEDKANGPAIIEMLRLEFPNVIALNPKTSKESRAHAANVYYQAGTVAHDSEMIGLVDFENALKIFPRGRKKDLVDALCQGLLYLGGQSDTDRTAALSPAADRAWDAIARALGGFSDHYSIG